MDHSKSIASKSVDGMLDVMNNHEIILDPILRNAAASELEYWYKAIQTVHTADPSHIYIYSGGDIDAADMNFCISFRDMNNQVVVIHI